MKISIPFYKKYRVAFIIVLLSLYFADYNSMLASEYAVSKIPDNLQENANSIYRLNNKEIIIDGPSSYTVKRKKVVTVLNENGKNSGNLAIQYDDYTGASFKSGEIYDENGDRITNIRKRDLTDRSFISDYALYQDTRILKYVPRISSYPYTVRYEYEISYSRGLYYAMFFYPTGYLNTSTQKASLQITHPIDHKMSYKEFNLDDEAYKKQINSNTKQIKWNFENIDAIKREYLSPRLYKYAPAVVFASKEFEFEGYYGKGNSWKDFGKWVWSIKQGQDELPEDRIDYIKEMVSGYDDDRKKIKTIYQYLQSRTRYVNIRLGIGGLKPLDAKTVDQKSYGDCKALNNYMRAMLKAVGIDSYYTLIKSGVGRYDFFENFTVNQFNHVILCVPLQNDTIWLECTNQHIPFGYLGSMNDNRPVLIIKEDGGYLSETPAYKRKENLQNTNATIILNNQGHGEASIKIDFGGMYFSNLLRQARMSEDNRKRWLYRNFSLPNYTIENNNIIITEDSLPIASLEMDISLRSYADMTGQRMFVKSTPVLANINTPPRNRNRNNPFELKFESSISDTITFVIPKGYVVESSLPDYSFESKFGEYNTEMIIKENEILYIRNFETYSGFFPAKKYHDYFNFYQKINRADNQSIVLRKE